MRYLHAHGPEWGLYQAHCKVEWVDSGSATTPFSQSCLWGVWVGCGYAHVSHSLGHCLCYVGPQIPDIQMKVRVCRAKAKAKGWGGTWRREPQAQAWQRGTRFGGGIWVTALSERVRDLREREKENMLSLCTPT